MKADFLLPSVVISGYLFVVSRFYRVDVARSRSTGGFGLGLAIAQQSIQAHGGQITATSTLSKAPPLRSNFPSKRWVADIFLTHLLIKLNSDQRK